MIRPSFHPLEPGLKLPPPPGIASSPLPLYVASAPAGIEAYRQLREAEGVLHLWISDEKVLSELRETARDLNPRFVFPFRGLRPSRIVRHGSFEGPTLFEIPDPRIRDPRLLEPAAELLQKASGSGRPEFSVIIPFFENEDRSRIALESWLAIPDPAAELILVDDGSSSDWVSGLQGRCPERLTLLRLERRTRRKRGDFLFRAGLARNHGARRARGERLVFCDSDMIVPSHFLEELRRGFRTHDVLMPRRWQLSERASKSLRRHEDVHFGRDTLLSPGAYWESFQTGATPWAEHPHPWKWASTFCLAVRREAFERAGGFKKTFVTYGFEDSELGYRLFRAGERFLRLETDLYHLHQPASHSEYGNDPERKNRLLRISADRFFRHHPTKDVYEALKEWLD